MTIYFCRTSVFPECPEKRSVDVVIEERKILGGYEIGERGLGVPELKGPFRVDVNDGVLDVVFRLQWRCHVSALEVRRL